MRCCAISCITISIHALLAESDTGISQIRTIVQISIHALLAESDAPSPPRQELKKDFYPRSPCGERPPLTSRAKAISAISIHALLAESDTRRHDVAHREQISIHALLAESDRVSETLVPRQNQFLSTLSLRRATQCRL